jgi:hypothetical protein
VDPRTLVDDTSVDSDGTSSLIANRLNHCPCEEVDSGSEDEDATGSDASSDSGDPIPFSPEELKAMFNATPSHWAQIQPAGAHQLPINDGATPGPDTADLDALPNIYHSYPFHTSRDLREVRRRITWKPRRGGDMAMLAGTCRC